MMPVVSRIRIWLLAALAIPFFAGGASAQSVLRGRVVGPSGEAVGGATVVLHRVGEGGGREVGRSESDGEGRFSIEFDREGGEGVYFAATRYEDQLYVGAFFRDPSEVAGEYVLRVGVNPVAGGGAAVPPGPRPEGGFPWIGLVIGAAAAAAVILPLRGAKRRPLATRAILAELAELEERGDAGEESRNRRDELRTRLRGPSALAVQDAADPH
jgi:hypothetical protein